MSFRSGISRERARKRRRFMGRVAVVLAVVGGLVVLGYTAYETGSELARLRVVELEKRTTELMQQVDDANGARARTQATLGEVQQSLDRLQKRYNNDVPAGPAAELFALIQGRISAGVPAARMTQVVRETAALRPCETRTVRKRFAIQAAGSRTPETVSMLEGLLQVSAMAGNDSKAVTVTVSPMWSDEPIVMTGLPARHDIVVNNAVLKLSVEASDLAGYASVILSTCGKV